MIHPSILEQICREEFTKHVKSLLHDILKQPKYSTNYNETISDFIKKWLVNNAEQLVQATILSLAETTAQSIISGLEWQTRT